MSGPRRPRVHIVDRDADLVESLSAVLADAGYVVSRCQPPAPEPEDVLVIGVPPPPGVRPPLVRGVPIVVLALSCPSFGELEEWIRGRPRWALCSKPVPEDVLLDCLRELLAEPAPPAASAREAR